MGFARALIIMIDAWAGPNLLYANTVCGHAEITTKRAHAFQLLAVWGAERRHPFCKFVLGNLAEARRGVRALA